jgi:hypothetical protein
LNFADVTLSFFVIEPAILDRGETLALRSLEFAETPLEEILGVKLISNNS